MVSRLAATSRASMENFSILRDAVNLLTQQNEVMRRDLAELKDTLGKLAEHVTDIRKPNYQLITIAIGFLAAFVTYYTASSISPVSREIDKLAAEVLANKQINSTQTAALAIVDQETNRRIQEMQTGLATIQVSLREIETQFGGLYTIRNQDKASSQNNFALIWQKVNPGQPWPSETFYPSPPIQLRPHVGP